MNGSPVLDDERIPETGLFTKTTDFFGGFTCAGDDRNSSTLQETNRVQSRRPVVAMVHQRAIEVGNHPPLTLQSCRHDLTSQSTS